MDEEAPRRCLLVEIATAAQNETAVRAISTTLQPTGYHPSVTQTTSILISKENRKKPWGGASYVHFLFVIERFVDVFIVVDGMISR